MIKKWKKFIESVSGLPGADTAPIGPNFGEQKLPTTLNKSDTQLIEAKNGTIYSINQFQELYNEYLSEGGKENLSEFSKENIDLINQYLGK